jgi:NAD(P)-dependent dehydrogenase (short-subunit alcohol dehydrogenase family)
MATVFITGGNRGIGFAFVQKALAEGHKVIATFRQGPGELAKISSPDLRTLALDVGSDDSVRVGIGELGAEPVDILINNAGVGFFGNLYEAESTKVQQEFNVNALGPLRVTRALLPNLRRGSQKKIASITSLLGSVADNSSGGSYGYRMSKAALNMFNKSLSIDLRDEGFTCVVFNPGWVKTDMGGANSKLTPAESVNGMWSVLQKLSPPDTGKFFHYDGKELPW